MSIRHAVRRRPYAVPASRGAGQSPPWIGDLRTEEMRDERLMRYASKRVSSFWMGRELPVLGEPFEPQVIAMSSQALTLSGE